MTGVQTCALPIYNDASELEDAAQYKIDDAKRRLKAAENIQYPEERKKEIENAKALKVEGINDMEPAIIAQRGAENLFIINKYKFLLGAIDEEHPDHQRLEYIPK